MYRVKVENNGLDRFTENYFSTRGHSLKVAVYFASKRETIKLSVFLETRSSHNIIII